MYEYLATCVTQLNAFFKDNFRADCEWLGDFIYDVPVNGKIEKYLHSRTYTTDYEKGTFTIDITGYEVDGQIATDLHRIVDRRANRGNSKEYLCRLFKKGHPCVLGTSTAQIIFYFDLEQYHEEEEIKQIIEEFEKVFYK